MLNLASKFDKTAKTYISITGEKQSAIGNYSTIMYNGDKKLKAKETKTSEGDYFFELDANGCPLVTIDANVLDGTNNLKFVYSASFSGGASTGTPKVTIKQD